MRQLDLIGQIFGKLTVLEKVDPIRKHSAFLCKCECGNTRIVIGCRLKLKQVSCCGCSDGDAKRRVKYLNRKLYEVWKGMKARCRDENHISYKNYGGRGISVCAEWQNSFIPFYEWAIENGYNPGLILDRYPDNDGNYAPFNCRWATKKESGRRTRHVKLSEEIAAEIRGSCLSNRELAKKYNVYPSTIGSIKKFKTWA